MVTPKPDEHLIPIDPEELHFRDGRSMPDGEPAHRYILSQMGGPEFYGLVRSKPADGDSAQLANSIIDEMINTLGENKESAGVQDSIVLLRDVYKRGILAKILDIISVQGFPEWQISAGGDMVVNQRAVDNLLRWLRKYKSKNAAFDDLQALANPPDTVPEPVEPITRQDTNKPVKQEKIKILKRSGLFRIAALLGEKGGAGSKKQMNRAEYLIKETSEITGIPDLENDINLGVAEIAVLQSMNSKDGGVELSQAYVLVNIKAAIITKRTGPTPNNLALVEIAALLGDAEDLHGAYEWIEQTSVIRGSNKVWEEENVELATTRAESQWEQQHNASMEGHGPTRGGIDLNTSNGMQWQSTNDGRDITMNIDPAILAQLQNAPGFVPVIINIQPMNDLREFLGLKQLPQLASD